jgi:AraC family transcriptional regulator
MRPISLARSFRRHFGISVAGFLRQVRVEAAQQLLRSSTESLAEIALSAGFADQSHFTRVFHQETGATPLQYRRDLT